MRLKRIGYFFYTLDSIPSASPKSNEIHHILDSATRM